MLVVADLTLTAVALSLCRGLGMLSHGYHGRRSHDMACSFDDPLR